MRSFTAGRYRFQEEPVTRTDSGLPPSVDLLALLIPERAATVPPPQAPPTTAANPALDSIRSLIEPELAEFLGPMAAFVCQEHLTRVAELDSANGPAELVDAIAKEIGDRTKEEHFRQRVLAKLKTAPR